MPSNETPPTIADFHLEDCSFWLNFPCTCGLTRLLGRREIEARLDELGKVPLNVSIYPELVGYRINRFAQLYESQKKQHL